MTINIIANQYLYSYILIKLEPDKKSTKMGQNFFSIYQGWAKTRVFHQKPNPVGLTGLNRVLMGFMG